MVKEMLQESLGDEYSVVEYSHAKNNKKTLSGLAIQRIGTDLGMVIYLDKVFDEYQNGREADKIAADLYREIRNAEIPKELSGDFMSALVNNYESAKPMNFCKLVNEKANREMLRKVPYFPFLDLAVIFYIQVSKSNEGEMAITIDHKIMNLWGIDSRQFYQDTIYHMETSVPQQLQSFSDIMDSFLDEEEKIILREVGITGKGNFETTPELYCLRNSSIFGASSLLYGDTMAKFAEQEQCDMLILPSSICEVLLLVWVSKARKYILVSLAASSLVFVSDKEEAVVVSTSERILWVLSVSAPSFSGEGEDDSAADSASGVVFSFQESVCAAVSTAAGRKTESGLRVSK